MRVAVRPPEYFPRLAYVALFGLVDCFVIADTFPYSRQSYQNRCRIRTAQASGTTWLSIPLEGSVTGKSPIEIRTDPSTRWRNNHWKSIQHHLGSAPFFDHFAPEVHAILESSGTVLADITSKTSVWLAQAIFPQAKILRASEVAGPNSSLQEILITLGASSLVTLSESEQSDRRVAEQLGIELQVVDYQEQPRRQNFPGFVAGCSTLDLLLNHGPASRAAMLADVEALHATPLQR